MRLLRTVWRDLYKDVGWLLFFGVTTAVLLSSLFVFYRNYRAIVNQNIALHKLEEHNVWFADVFSNDETFFGNGGNPLPRTNGNLLLSYFEEAFNHDGVGGF